MCGIFGLNCKTDEAIKIILDGIGNLEHRGYDSMGIAFVPEGENKARVFKTALEEKEDINIDDLKLKVGDIEKKSRIGLGHTRWATYGAKTIANAHPHFCNDLFLVHNGNVENYDELKKELLEKDLYSETDTEVIVNLIDKERSEKQDLVSAVKKILKMISGANSFVLFDQKEKKLIAANKGGTLLLAKTDKGVIVASDPSALDSHKIRQKRVLEVNEIAVINSDFWEIFTARKNVSEQDFFQDKGKQGYNHFMEKEIMEQPLILKNGLAGRILPDRGTSKLGGIEEILRHLRNVDTFHFIGCGTAYNACLYASLLFNRFGIKSKAWIASEFCYSHPVFSPGDAFIFISQSGETADTIEAIEEIKLKGNICLGIVNVPDSKISRLVDAGVYIRAGREKGVASTKAFTAQLNAIVLLATTLARQRKMTIDTGFGILSQLEKIPSQIEIILKQKEKIKKIAKKYSQFSNFYFLGRYFHSVIAEEGSLKLKEISYLHAESYPLGEMKHGPLALVDSDFCSVVIIPKDSVYEKGLVNLREIKGRDGPVLAITTTDSGLDLADDIIYIPKIESGYEFFYPFLTIIPLQLLAYFAALKQGQNPDKPRNLAKTVTVG